MSSLYNALAICGIIGTFAPRLAWFLLFIVIVIEGR